VSKKFTERLGFALLSCSAVGVLLLLGVILFDIFSKGIGVISWKFLSQPPQQGMTEGGIFPAILGTFLVSIITVVFAVPLGMFAAIYLHEYARPGRTTRMIRLAIRNLSGVLCANDAPGHFDSFSRADPRPLDSSLDDYRL
jgi:phosphate transport system permease protein